MGKSIRVICMPCRERLRKKYPVIVLPGNREHHLRENHQDIEDPEHYEKYFEFAEVEYYRRHHEDDHNPAEL